MCSTEPPRLTAIPPPLRGGYVERQTLPRVARRRKRRRSTRGYIPRPRWGQRVRHSNAATDAAKAHGLSARQALALLGRETHDVYLNDRAYWKNVPAGVWGYYIGGYQVVKKWLSYREKELLGRPLRPEEAREVTAMVRRLAAIVLLEPALDENYRRIKASAYAWLAQ